MSIVSSLKDGSMFNLTSQPSPNVGSSPPSGAVTVQSDGSGYAEYKPKASDFYGVYAKLLDQEFVANAESLAWQEAQNQKAMDFSAKQAAMNRVFQQTSADKAMNFNAEQAELNRQFQQMSADKAMEFQERMSNTSYQRAVEDLKAAGLNPILAYTKAGASTPTGSTASGSSASGSSASGSAASGTTSAGNKVDIAKSLNAAVSLYNTYANNTTKMVSSLIPW